MVIPAKAFALQFTFWENVNFGEVASASSQSTPLVVAEAKHICNKSSSFLPLCNAAVHWEKNSCAAVRVGAGEKANGRELFSGAWDVRLHFSSFLWPCSCAA